jgi:AhpD family alkylhydroperoxidase
MEARLNPFANPILARFGKHIVAADQMIKQSTLPDATRELVMLRASQINGCGVCVDMHTKDAAHAGETSTRLNMVAAWRDATVFTEAERAALELAEEGTRIADGAGGVSAEVWANAANHYDEDQLAALVCTIALINAFNRGNVILELPAGDYQPGQVAPARLYSASRV